MIFNLTFSELVLCLAGAAIFCYILPYLVALLFIILGIICTVVGLLIEGIGYLINKLFGGRK